MGAKVRSKGRKFFKKLIRGGEPFIRHRRVWVCTSTRWIRKYGLHTFCTSNEWKYRHARLISKCATSKDNIFLVEGKWGFCSSYRLHFVSFLHEVMVPSTLLPKWLVMTSQWWHHGGIPRDAYFARRGKVFDTHINHTI